MQIIRTVIWVIVLIALLIFSLNNWTQVDVKIWEGLILETKLPVLVGISFLLGLLPMWLLHRAASWRAHRRISALQNAARPFDTSPSLSTTALAAEAPDNPAN